MKKVIGLYKYGSIIFILAIYPVGVYNELANQIKKKRGNNGMEKERSEESDCCCTQKSKNRTETEYKDLLNRLNRIEGQIRGIRKMVEKNAYCVDILTQSAAASAALNSFNKVLLSNHIHTCVADGIRQGDEEVVEELVKMIQKLMK